WDIAVRQGGLLLRAEEAPRIWKSFTGPDASGRWECTLDRQVRRFRNITTIEEYLEKRNLFPSQAITLSGTIGTSNGGSQYGGHDCQDKIGPILRKIETFERVPRCYRLSTPCTAKCAEFD